MPVLTLPTRITDSSATLIDNIFTNTLTSLNSSGIIISELSDHFPCFYHLKLSKDYLKPPKFVFKRNFSDKNVERLYKALESENIMNTFHSCKNKDVNMMYNTLEDILIRNLNKYIPIKNSKWVTNGIIKSIRFRDNLYKYLKTLKPDSIYFKIQNRILKFTIKY